ncbi:hypothetical protein [Methylobacterium organophilum]|uniref:Uncharacterized protein n=1 Tax=Methylobacterium organophilum TaxID=410 RepID=A0ABQ4T6R7_METOR|nr:hypothetical protein [Methylobacterium organophilum]UMY17253.1 hypothetical protein MMB17_21885 [Methylobacterium organophilum]GJE26711.1 hypothetical protein LKMONMHP_1562 [Methylobacterium organophilum]
MTIGSLNSLGPVRAAELGLSLRNDAAARHAPPETVTVEVVRPVDPATKLRADADVMRSEPVTERRLIDIKV